MTQKEFREKVKESPDTAYTELYNEYFKYVYAIVYNKLNTKEVKATKEDIEDCVADVFAMVWKKFDNDGNFESDMKCFILSVTRNIAAEHSKKILRNKSLNIHNCGIVSKYIEDNPICTLPDTQDIEDDLERNETREILLKAIDELGNPDNKIIIFRYFYNLSFNEIAEKLKLNTITLRVRYHRALKKLEKKLNKEDFF